MSTRHLPLPPLDVLERALEYNPENGHFFWKKGMDNHIMEGEMAGCFDPVGYVLIGINTINYKASRLAYYMSTGVDPGKFQVDHINCIKSDNRICNLRLTTNGGNQQNTKLQKNNKSGVKGVSWVKARKRWSAYLTANGKRIHIGHFKELEDAKQAITKYRMEFHNEFANFG